MRTQNYDDTFRFICHVQAVESGCWLWIGGKDKKGYGKFWWGGKTGRAHRWAYQRWRGVIPNNLEPDHLCRITGCVNPDHLEVVTRQVNVLRGNSPVGINGRKTHCCRGHLLAGDNLYTYTRNGYVQRGCKACSALRAVTRYHANPQLFRDQKNEAYAKSREQRPKNS